ncbi:MAG: hypothetical protein ACM3O6_01385, partial [Acidobacteriota bacterium]
MIIAILEKFKPPRRQRTKFFLAAKPQSLILRALCETSASSALSLKVTFLAQRTRRMRKGRKERGLRLRREKKLGA